MQSRTAATVGAIYLNPNGTLTLKNDSTTIGSSTALSVNTLYRIGLHQRSGSGNGVLEAWVQNATSNDTAFGTAFAGNLLQTISGSASELRLGATNSNPVNAIIDDIRLDSGAMP